jgi:small-conductance mechanosensitive channel
MGQLIGNINFQEIFTIDNLLPLGRSFGLLFFGVIAVRITAYLIKRFVTAKANDQIKLLVDKAVRFSGMTFVGIFFLASLGVNPTPLLGAAGILGVALSIASQNSLSNIISGLFLISEKPFTIGDVIRIGERTGVVHSIDLLSIKMRTFDNLYIRIPSEKILNGEVVNVTRFPIRRQDFTFLLPYDTDLNEVTTLLKTINDENVLCLNEPAPIILYQEISAAGIKLLFGVWFVKTDYVATRNSVIEMVQREFGRRGIRFQVPIYQHYSPPSSSTIVQGNTSDGSNIPDLPPELMAQESKKS